MMVVRAILPDILFLQETHYITGGEHKDYVEGMTIFHSSIPRGRTRSRIPVELPTHQRGRRAGLATALKNSLDPNRIDCHQTRRDSSTQGLLTTSQDRDSERMHTGSQHIPPTGRHAPRAHHESHRVMGSPRFLLLRIHDSMRLVMSSPCVSSGGRYVLRASMHPLAVSILRGSK